MGRHHPAAWKHDGRTRGPGREEWQMTTVTEAPPGGRIRAAWVAAHAPAAGVPRWARAEFPDGTPGAAADWPQRRRTLGWFLLHVFTGALLVAAVLGLIALAGNWWTVPAAAATVFGMLLAGRFLAWLGPVLLGPSQAERLQRLEADAARATERNRIAREIHDSVGHALSVVTVQAGPGRCRPCPLRHRIRRLKLMFEQPN
jgi:Histidine kinase